MKRTFTRRHFTKMSGAAAAALASAQSSFAALAQAPAQPPQVEDPNVAAPQGIARSNAPASNDPAAQWSGHDSPELVARALEGISAVPPGPFQPTWDSIQQNYTDPEWFRDAKFGIMMHWGIYSVPAHGRVSGNVRYMYGGNGRHHAVAHRALRAAYQVRL